MKPIFKAKDGSEHPTQESATLRNELLEASREFEQAGEKLTRLIGANALTADGQPFDFRQIKRFWVIQYWGGWPRLKEVDIYWYNAQVEHLSYSEETHLSLTCRDGATGRESYRISDLYADRRAAEIALTKVRQEKLAEYQSQIDDLRPVR